ncbi:MAG TPA: histidinol-phosphatase [Hyphomicrobiales bacterium]|nr:histidinol-phosphatase [Hyphomicrobiales bacterium]
MTAVDFAAFVDRLADAAAEAVLPFFRTAIGMEDKSHGGRFDPVTAADHAGEAALRQLIQRTFPTHGIIGEEFGSERTDADYVWVLDPIDGTRAFVCGMPAWGTLIGLLRGGQPVYGMMSQPFIRERFHGDGASARYRGPNGNRKLATRPCRRLADAVVATTSPRMFTATEGAAFEAVEAEARLTRFGGDCYSYCMLAAGHVDLVIEAGLKPYDIVALIPIVEGAGGVVTTWTGAPATEGGRIVAAGDPAVHAAALERLQGID